MRPWLVNAHKYWLANVDYIMLIDIEAGYPSMKHVTQLLELVNEGWTLDACSLWIGSFVDGFTVVEKTILRYYSKQI